jgi:outer membrane immunogenic protein
MKKVIVALVAAAAFTGPALAADMAAKAPMRAAPVAYAPSWTGCYVGGGGGYGMFTQENVTYLPTVPRTDLTSQWDTGGRGWFGTVQGGCDYQFSAGLPWNLVIGAFADYDFADIKGEPTNPWSGLGGREKLSSQWAVGGRVGATITPSLLVYFVGGYTEAKFDRLDLFAKTINNIAGLPIGADAGVYVPGQTYKGWFLGAGDEYALSVLPGLFWKTEYRFSDLDRATTRSYFTATNAWTGVNEDQKNYVHTVRSELVYRFNWGGTKY